MAPDSQNRSLKARVLALCRSYFIPAATSWHLLLLSTLLACQPQRLVLSGSTMGTTYHIVVEDPSLPESAIKARLEKRLSDLTMRFSTYEPESEISSFNRSSAGQPVHAEFVALFKLANRLHILSDRTFDPTIEPLVALWGFYGIEAKKPPKKAAIQNRLKFAGMDKIALTGNSLLKKIPEARLDLSAIAKGYGADALYEELLQMGLGNAMVEIGGEVRAGSKKNGFWKIGIEIPEKMPSGRWQAVVALRNAGLATSGNYRHFFTNNGRRYGHIIDPRTGYPAESNVISASVLAKNCAVADGLATALLVLDAKSGLAMIAREPGVEAYLITTSGIQMSPGMKKHLLSE